MTTFESRWDLQEGHVKDSIVAQAPEPGLRLEVARVVRRTTSFDTADFSSKFGGLTRSRYAEHQTIYQQGSAGDAVFHIVDGGVKLAVVSKKGKEQVIAVLGPGDFFGQASLDGRRPRIASAITITECELVRLETAAIARALCEDLSFSSFFVSFLLQRNARLMDDLLDQLFHSSEQRLARALLLLATIKTVPNRRRCTIKRPWRR